MWRYVLLFVASGAITFLLTPISARFAARIGAIDYPKGERKIHNKPMPYGGGLAMFAAFFSVLFLTELLTDFSIDSLKFIGLFVACLIMLLVGLRDDIAPMRARTKFFAQVGAAGILILCGHQITHFTNFFTGEGQIGLGVFSIPITVIWIVGVTNTVNLIDGLDGLAAGISAIASLTVLTISLITDNNSIAIIAAILAGSCVGFLPSNFNPAKVFMGDAGAYFLGMVLSVISMEGGLKIATSLTIVVPILAIGIPIFDTAFAILRRVWNGRSIGEADRGHLHHRFLQIGFGQRKTVVAMYTINVLFGLGAVAIIRGDADYGVAFFMIAFVLMILPSSIAQGMDSILKNRESMKEAKLKHGELGELDDLPRVLSIFGTRPEAIKMAPLLKLLAKERGLRSIVCVTGQHREQLDQVLDAFEIRPDFDLNLMRQGQTLAEISSRTFAKVDEVLEIVRPNLVLVHGDPSATFCAATVAFYRGIPVAHVEAGLRSGNIDSPFPEEFNRIVVDRISKLHFAPTPQNRDRLLEEGCAEATVHVTGNTAIDAIASVVRKDYEFEDETLRRTDFSKKVILLTAHRRENLGERMRSCFRGIRRVADEHEDVEIIYPMHLNKLVRDAALEVLGDHPRINLIEPLGYFDISNLMARCYLVVTDSGGLQEEAPALGKPVVVMRTETERQEAVDAGTVVIAGVEEENIHRIVSRLLSDPQAYAQMATSANPYGDGHASERIVGVIRSYLGVGDEAAR